MNTPLTWIELDAAAFSHNCRFYKSRLLAQQLGIVLKSNAYGHGLIPMAHLCQHEPSVDWLMTGTLSEAIALRQQGITKPILVLYYLDEDPALAAQYNIECSVGDHGTLERLLRSSYKQSISIHLEIDTGMHRFGFDQGQLFSILSVIGASRSIQVTGIFSHLAGGSLDQSRNNSQQHQFELLVAQARQAGFNLRHIHLTRSVSSLLLPGYSNNLTRIGFGAYGWLPDEIAGVDLRPIITLKTTIVTINKVAQGQSIGYEPSFVTQRETKIGIIPIGYNDFFDRRMSNRGHVLVHGKIAPIIGLIAMNATMIDLTDINEACQGDEVTVLGAHDAITPHALAQKIESGNPREILTRLNRDIIRIIK